MEFIKLTFNTTDDFHKSISYMIGFLFLLSYYDLFISCDVNLNSSSTRLGNALILIFLFASCLVSLIELLVVLMFFFFWFTPFRLAPASSSRVVVQKNLLRGLSRFIQ